MHCRRKSFLVRVVKILAVVGELYLFFKSDRNTAYKRKRWATIKLSIGMFFGKAKEIGFESNFSLEHLNESVS